MKNKNKNNLKEVQEKLEHQLKDNLLKDPSQKSFQEAYDKIHTFFIEQEKISSIYSTELNWFSKIFIDLSGSGNKVLDIGSGNGKLAISMAQKGNTVIGLDVSKIAVEKASESLKKKSQTLLVEFRLGDARKLPFEDNTFHFITSQDLIEHISEEDFNVHLKEVYRVLKPGGRYLFWTPSALKGGSSHGLHIKEYNLAEIDKIIRQTSFSYSWFDLRFYKVKVKFRLNQSIMFPVIFYEKLLGKIIKFIPGKFKKIFIPPLLFQLKK